FTALDRDTPCTAAASWMPICTHSVVPDAADGARKWRTQPPPAFVFMSTEMGFGPGSSVPPLYGVGELDRAARIEVRADGAALDSVSDCWVVGTMLPVPSSSGSPETPASAEPSFVHALVAPKQVQALPTAVPHWPAEPGSWTAPQPLLYTTEPAPAGDVPR